MLLLRHACCHVCSARWNGKCVDRGTAVVYSYTPIKAHGVSQANLFPFHTLFTSRKKYMIWNKNYPACCNPTNYEESSRWSLILVASYNMPQRKVELLFYTVKKNPGPRGDFPNLKNFKMMKMLQNKNPSKGLKWKIQEKNSIRSFTELKKKKDSPTVFHLNQNVSQIIEMFAK